MVHHGDTGLRPPSVHVCVPSLNVGIPVRKILRIYCVSISRTGDLDLRPLTLKLVHIISRGMDNLRANFGVTRMFYSRLIGQHLADASHDLATLTLEVTTLVADARLRAPSVYQV